MRWLIVEDALRDRKGHWFEYLRTFDQGLRGLGDQVTLLADRRAESFILKTLRAKPLLPESIWHRMGDGAGALKRYGRVPLHAWQTWRSMRHFLKKDPNWDIIFVPTVLVHHLLGWYRLIRHLPWKGHTRILLFFPNLPIKLEADGTPAWIPSPTTRLMSRLLAKLKPDILSGRVILGVETREMRQAFAHVTGLPAVYFPHPVQSLPASTVQIVEETPEPGGLLMACYGPGRGEKGSDILQEALARHLDRHPGTTTRFAFQWTQDFSNNTGELIRLDPSLLSDPRVNIIRRYFNEGEYAQHLLRTRVLLLPYRRSSYALRVSRVMIEAMVNGIPAVITQGTTLHSQAVEFGAALTCKDGSVESLETAIKTAEDSHRELHALATNQKAAACEHFSVKHFRDLLLAEMTKYAAA